MTALWGALRTAFADKGTRLVVLSAPPRPLFAPEAALPSDAATAALGAEFSKYIAQLNAAGIQAPDLTKAVEAEFAQNYYFARDTHWTPRGAAWSALQLGQAIGHTQQKLDEIQFTETFTEKGSLSAVVERICGARPSAEDVPSPIYAAAGGADALFASGEAATVALVGTSFSNRYQTDAYQVAGALSFALGAAVENFSVTGGGLVGAMEAFVQSGALDTGQFETVVWETPYTSPLTQVAGLRQVLGALDNDVSAIPLYAGRLTDDWQIVKLKTVIVPGGTLRIETPGIDVGQLSVELFSPDGEKVRLKLRKSERVEKNQRSDIWQVSLLALPLAEVSRIKLKLDTVAHAARVSLLN